MDFLADKPLFLRDIAVKDLLDAKIHTADFLIAHGLAPESDEEIEKEAARSVFSALTGPNTDTKTQRQAVALLETPEAVRQLVTMLTAYDWQFITQANQIRSYVVARLLEECDHPDSRVALKALELTGKISEIGLFEERVNVKRTDMTDSELDEKIRARMERIRALEKPTEPPIEAAFTEKQGESGEQAVHAS